MDRIVDPVKIVRGLVIAGFLFLVLWPKFGPLHAAGLIWLGATVIFFLGLLIVVVLNWKELTK